MTFVDIILLLYPFDYEILGYTTAIQADPVLGGSPVFYSYNLRVEDQVLAAVRS